MIVFDTFGLVEPQVVVVYAGVFGIMDADELRFIIGHELGHVCLGHTWLNSLVGGLAGIPSPYLAAVVLYFAFRWWNRACEYSADRAGLLACGKPEKAASALIKLVGDASAIRSAQGWQQARQLRQPDLVQIRRRSSPQPFHDRGVRQGAFRSITVRYRSADSLARYPIDKLFRQALLQCSPSRGPRPFPSTLRTP